MKIFISWSKNSMEYAIKIKALLESIDSNIKTFISEKDINAGEDVQEKIINNIVGCDKLILCFTKDNKMSPWLLFEAGYARALKKTVIPFLFDIDSNWHSWIDNPMNIAREIFYNDENFGDKFIQSLEIVDTKINREKIENFKTDIIDIKDKNRIVDIKCEDFINKLTSSKAFTLESPIFRDKTALFFAGFESYDLYKAIVESFLYTGKYLWIYGRKNMKLFGGSFKEFFRYLDEKSYNHNDMAGIDFRCLFLNPDSEEVKHAYIKPEIFKPELEATLLRARNMIGDNKRIKQCFRLYSNKREAIIIRLDNSIIYARPMFDTNGVPQILTDTPFEVFSIDTARGQECVRTFEEVWSNAQEMC